MKVSELIEKLSQYDENVEVVIEVQPNADVEAYETNRIDEGWLPSNVISIVGGEQILS